VEPKSDCRTTCQGSIRCREPNWRTSRTISSCTVKNRRSEATSHVRAIVAASISIVARPTHRHRTHQTAQLHAMSQIPDDADLPLNANRPAYLSRHNRDGIIFSCVGEKLGLSSAYLHRQPRRCLGERDDLRCAIYHGLVTFFWTASCLSRHEQVG
jgi:hypothetical protein